MKRPLQNMRPFWNVQISKVEKKELKDFGSLSSQHIFLGFFNVQWS
jgi:hypothetical protein